MKKRMKKLIALLTATTISLSMLVGCGSSDSGSSASSGAASDSATSGSEVESGESNGSAGESQASVSTESHKIAVFTLKATGSIVEAEEAFLENISDDLNFTYEVRYAGDDASTFLSNVETAIAEGFEGIISMTDKGNTAAILELCEESDVYFGYTWCNMGSSLNSSDSGYDILKSEKFVGSIASCTDTYDEAVVAYAEQIAAEYEALSDSEKEGSIGITTNPARWTPGQQIAAENMYRTLTGEYGIPDSAFATATIEKRAEDESYAGQTLEAGTWQFPQVDISSFALPNAYFQSNSNLKLICSWASITYIEPALQTAGLHGKVKVWTCGYEAEDYLLNNFGTQGDQTYQGDFTAPIEAVAFPLVLILDKLNGNSYAEHESKIAELVASMESGEMSAKFQLKNYMIPYSSSIIVSSDDELERFKSHYVYGNGNGADSIVSADDLKKLMVTYNSEATYEDLVAFFDYTGSLTMSAIQ